VLLSTTDFLPPISPQPESSMMAHGMKYPALFGQVGSARPAVFPRKINPVLAESRTRIYTGNSQIFYNGIQQN